MYTTILTILFFDFYVKIRDQILYKKVYLFKISAKVNGTEL